MPGHLALVVPFCISNFLLTPKVKPLKVFEFNPYKESMGFVLYASTYKISHKPCTC